MSDSPAPATAPTGQPAPPAQPAAPAQPASPPQPASQPASQPHSNPPQDQPVSLTDTLEYVDPQTGQRSEYTVQQLVEAQKRMEGLGDLDQINDLKGFLSGDTDAQRKILQSQLDALNPQPSDDPKDQYIKQLEEKYTALESRMGRIDRVVDQTEQAEDRTYVESLIGLDAIQKNFPFIATKPELAATILQPQFTRLRRAAAEKGIDLSGRNDLVVQMLQGTEASLRQVAEAYGGRAAAQQQQQQPEPQPQQQPYNPYQQQYQQYQPVIPGMAPQVPQPGGVAPQGGVPVAGQQDGAQKPQTRAQLLAQIRAKRQMDQPT